MNKKIVAVPVRELLKHSEEDTRLGLNNVTTLLFEDNMVEVDVKPQEVHLLRYLLGLLTDLPNVPITSLYLPRKYYINGFFTTRVINEVFEAMLKDIVEIYVHSKSGIENNGILDKVYEDMMDINNDIYNNLVFSNLRYGGTTSILDYIEIQLQPKLIKTIQHAADVETETSVRDVYTAVEDVIKNDIDLDVNSVARGYLSGIMKKGQLDQALGVRGFGTRLNDKVYKKPITSSFTLGLKDVYELSVESVAGGKSLYLSTIGIETTEYFGRSLQLVVMPVEHLKYVDCGNRETIAWYVRPESPQHKSDLKSLIGSRHFVNGVESIVTAKDTHLVGTTIQLRKLQACKLHDKTSICSYCFGELSRAVHAHTNLGMYCSTKLSADQSQNVLSAKHLIASIIAAALKLKANAEKIFKMKGDNYMLKKEFIHSHKSVELIVSQEEGYGLRDITPDVDIERIDATRVSNISIITIKYVDKNDNVHFEPIEVRNSNRYGSFTVEFLKYIQGMGLGLDKSDNYIFDIKGFDITQPIINVPQVQTSYVKLILNIKALLDSKKARGAHNEVFTPETLLFKLFNLISEKTEVNIAILQVIVYAFSISDEYNNYYPSRHKGDKSQIALLSKIIGNRSLGAMYAWERVEPITHLPVAYDKTNKMDHLLDTMLRPKEVVKKYSGIE